MSRYLKSNSHVTLVFQAEKNSNKSRNMGTVCSYYLSGRAGREIFGSWWQLTDFAALGPHGMTRRAKYFPVWPDLASRYTFKRKTAVFLVFPFFLHISSSPLMGPYAGLCDFSRPCSCHYVHFLYRDFFIRIRISKTHRCLLPVCKNPRV